MVQQLAAADQTILDLLRRRGGMTVTDLAMATEVTATAVRQRLTRLLALGLIQREATKEGRGRPSHHYTLTSKGERQTGSNFADLAMALWEEVRAIKDAEVRRGLLQRISSRLAGEYAAQVAGEDRDDRMDAVVELFRARQLPFEVDRTNPQLPVLTALACPYPELAEHDRGVCAMERMMFSEMVGENLRLNSCRLDGDKCCAFVPDARLVPGEPATV